MKVSLLGAYFNCHRLIDQYVQDLDTLSGASDPFVLLGLLANYNKFEFRNPYRVRLEDFVNEGTIKIIARCVGATCLALRDQYLALQDDSPESWGIGSTMSYFGLGAWTAKPRPAVSPNSDDVKAQFALLYVNTQDPTDQALIQSRPGTEVTIILALYDFISANKLFSSTFITMPPSGKEEVAPIASFLSFTSYLTQHAYRSTRATIYAYLSFLILQIMVEDQHLAKRICSNDLKVTIRLCRQNPPLLPPAVGPKPIAYFLMDIVIDAINHNLRRRLDVEFFM